MLKFSYLKFKNDKYIDANSCCKVVHHLYSNLHSLLKIVMSSCQCRHEAMVLVFQSVFDTKNQSKWMQFSWQKAVRK